MTTESYPSTEFLFYSRATPERQVEIAHPLLLIDYQRLEREEAPSFDMHLILDHFQTFTSQPTVSRSFDDYLNHRVPRYITYIFDNLKWCASCKIERKAYQAQVLL